MDMRRWAHFSADGDHRLILGRRWAEGAFVAFVGLNPSTADGDVDDPTIRRCIGFARDWGYGGLLVANLFTLRATDPRDLALAKRPLTLGADNALRDVADKSALVIEAWGAHPMAVSRQAQVRELLDGRAPRAVLGFTQAGAPRHPLYAPAGAQPQLVGGGGAVGAQAQRDGLALVEPAVGLAADLGSASSDLRP